MKLNTIVKFASMAFNLMQNEKFLQMLKLSWNLFNHRNQTKAGSITPRRMTRR
jgi:hypothetical protein